MTENIIKLISVDRIDLSALVSSERDPYGQDGFSNLTAEVLTKDEDNIAALKSAKNSKAIIKVRCAGLEVTGKVFKCDKSFKGYEAVLSVENLQLLKTA